MTFPSFLSDLSRKGVWALRYPVNPVVNKRHVIVFSYFIHIGLELCLNHWHALHRFVATIAYRL